MPYTQDNRLIAIDTPLGKDVLLLQGFDGQEGISQLFRYHLDLLSEKRDLNFRQIVGQRVTISVTCAGGKKRYINGFVSRFSQRGSDARFAFYQAEIVPWLWFLTRTTDCRIFQNMTPPDIVKKIFSDLGFTDFRSVLQGQYEKRDYCVQYRETDFDFVSRLMEQYGFFYFFEHEEEKHTLVYGDSPSAHQGCVGQERARCKIGAAARQTEDIVTSWLMEEELKPGKYALKDYNFETPSTDLGVTSDSAIKVAKNGKYEIYDYPGEYDAKSQGDKLVKLRREEEEAQLRLVQGRSNCRAFTSGYRFDLADHESAEMNKTYVLTRLHQMASVGDCYASGNNASEDELFSNDFTCMLHDTPYRPLRKTPKPIVQGPQTAVIVGPKGEEIYTDNYGRVKVQFHWDREGKRDEHSSCWIRVSYPWAGSGWGAVHIPRIGQEVIVDFLEGDPDQPIITGRVYNAEQMPPYGLPGNQTQSGIKSRSSKGGGVANFNEIRFEDKKGSEEVYIHAEKDQNIVVEHDKTEDIGHDQTEKIGHDRFETVGHDQTENVGHDKSETIGNNETITIVSNRMEQVGGNETLSVAKNRTRTVSLNEGVTVVLTRTHSVGVNEMINVGAAQEVTVGGFRALSVGLYQNTTIGANHTEQVGTNHSETIGNNHSETIGNNHSETIGNNHSEDVGNNHSETIGSDRSTKIGGNRQTDVGKDDSLKVGKNLVVDAGDQIVIKTGQASITMKKDGTIIIKGKAITVEATQKIEEKAMNITSEASTKSMTKGSMVNIEASGVNTIKGSLVKIN